MAPLSLQAVAGKGPPVLCTPQHKHPGKGHSQPSPEKRTVPSESDEFSSFLYWRAPLPSIEEELQELLVRPGASSLSLLSDQSTVCDTADCHLPTRKLKLSLLVLRPLRSTRALRMGPVLRKRKMRMRVTMRAG